MALKTFGSRTFAALTFAALTLHGPDAVAPVVPDAPVATLFHGGRSSYRERQEYPARQELELQLRDESEIVVILATLIREGII